MTGKKIAGLIILGIIVSGGTYLWFTDIQPDIDRVSKINQENREREEKMYQERTSSFQLDEQNPDCYYDEQQKVRICN